MWRKVLCTGLMVVTMGLPCFSSGYSIERESEIPPGPTGPDCLSGDAPHCHSVIDGIDMEVTLKKIGEGFQWVGERFGDVGTWIGKRILDVGEGFWSFITHPERVFTDPLGTAECVLTFFFSCGQDEEEHRKVQATRELMAENVVVYNDAAVAQQQLDAELVGAEQRGQEAQGQIAQVVHSGVLRNSATAIAQVADDLKILSEEVVAAHNAVVQGLDQETKGSWNELLPPMPAVPDQAMLDATQQERGDFQTRTGTPEGDRLAEVRRYYRAAEQFIVQGGTKEHEQGDMLATADLALHMADRLYAAGDVQAGNVSLEAAQSLLDSTFASVLTKNSTSFVRGIVEGETGIPLWPTEGSGDFFIVGKAFGTVSALGSALPDTSSDERVARAFAEMADFAEQQQEEKQEEKVIDVTTAALKGLWNYTVESAVATLGFIAQLPASTAVDPSLMEDFKGDIARRTRDVLRHVIFDYSPEERDVGKFFEQLYDYAGLARDMAGVIRRAATIGRTLGIEGARELGEKIVEPGTLVWVNTAPTSRKIHPSGSSWWTRIEQNPNRGPHWRKMEVDEALAQGYQFAQQPNEIWELGRLRERNYLSDYQTIRERDFGALPDPTALHEQVEVYIGVQKGEHPYFFKFTGVVNESTERSRRLDVVDLTDPQRPIILEIGTQTPSPSEVERKFEQAHIWFQSKEEALDFIQEGLDARVYGRLRDGSFVDLTNAVYHELLLP